jgi:hypothetical protein
MPRAGPRLGRGCFTRGEGVSGSGRSPRLGAGRFGWAALGCAGVGGEGSGCWVGLDFRLGFGPQPVLYLKFLFFFQICL